MRQLTIEEYRNRFYDLSHPEKTVMLYEIGPEDCCLPRRRPVSHKYSYGRAVIIGGCKGFSGAPWLAANACERSGAGLSCVMVPESIYPIVAMRCDGAVVMPLPSTKEGAVSSEALKEINGWCSKNTNGRTRHPVRSGRDSAAVRLPGNWLPGSFRRQSARWCLMQMP